MEEEEFCLDGRKPRSLKLFIMKRGETFPLILKNLAIYIDFGIIKLIILD